MLSWQKKLGQVRWKKQTRNSRVRITTLLPMRLYPQPLPSRDGRVQQHQQVQGPGVWGLDWLCQAASTVPAAAAAVGRVSTAWGPLQQLQEASKLLPAHQLLLLLLILLAWG
jgi:hypothetical protein